MPRSNTGLVFLSHWSGDAQKVQRLAEKLTRSNTFLDVRSIQPGSDNLRSMKEAITSTAVFVFVISPGTPDACFSFFEANHAEIESVRSKNMEILVWPIDGATYKNAPQWMSRYFSIPNDYSISDAAREVTRRLDAYLLSSGLMKTPVYEGREALERQIAIDFNTQQSRHSAPVNVVVLSGLEGMGRRTLGRSLPRRIAPGLRPSGPIFNLPDACDAVDIYLALFADIFGDPSPHELARLTAAFPSTPTEQAKLLADCLDHWAQINQPVVLRTRFSLRDSGNNLRLWFRELLRLLQKSGKGLFVFTSGRRLTPESILPHPNALHCDVPELDRQTVAYIIGALVGPNSFNPSLIERLSGLASGHPDTAHHVGYLVSKGRTPDTLLASPDTVYAFRDRVLRDVIDRGALSPLQEAVLATLCWFPGLDFSTIKDVFPSEKDAVLASTLWELGDYCLVEHHMDGSYRLPTIVRAAMGQYPQKLTAELTGRIAAAIKKIVERPTLKPGDIEALVSGLSIGGASLPDYIRNAITPGVLSNIVETYYNRGRSSGDRSDLESSFRLTAEFATLALSLNIPNDSLDNILFFGADALARLGRSPQSLITEMLDRGFASAYYVRASYKFHKERDYDGAIQDLRRMLSTGRFRRRTIRLLVRVYLRKSDAGRALDVLSQLSTQELHRDSGFLSMKIRALRMQRSHAEADNLERTLRTLDDDYGESLTFEASRALKAGNLDQARKLVDRALAKPKASRSTLMFLKCVIDLNGGSIESLADACSLAETTGRVDDAHQLRARAALVVKKNWREAERELAKVDNQTWFDWSLELQVLAMKARDDEVRLDAEKRSAVELRREEVSRRVVSAPEFID